MTPEDQPKLPKTVPEIGVHIFYINKTLTNIEKQLADTPTRKEFADLELRVTGHGKRLVALEDVNKGTMQQVLGALNKRIVYLIMILLLGSVGWSVYMTVRWQTAMNKLPGVIVKG